jgi:hypothetical protein
MAPLTGYGGMEDWVHDSGRMVLLGCTAQPLHVRRIIDCTVYLSMLTLSSLVRFKGPRSLLKTVLFSQDFSPILAQKIKYLSSSMDSRTSVSPGTALHRLPSSITLPLGPFHQVKIACTAIRHSDKSMLLAKMRSRRTKTMKAQLRLASGRR